MKVVRVLLVLLSVSTAGAAVSLQINGTAYDSMTLRTGQEVTVGVASNDTAAYTAYVGFSDASSALGTFDYQSTLPAAGNLAYATGVTVPPVDGYYLNAGGTKPVPSAGVQFQFRYVPETAGATVLTLYGKDGVKVLDEMAIFVEPAALGSAFTYQGRLLDGGEGRDGIYDFEFRLFDAPTEGNQIGETNFGEDIEVAGGYFTAELDFEGVYDGTNAWLEVAVKEGLAKVPFTVLSPRQKLTAAPNASYAATSDWNGLLNMPAGFADGVDNDTNTHLSESQVESYIANDVSTGSIPYDNGTKLVSSGLSFSGGNFHFTGGVNPSTDLQIAAEDGAEIAIGGPVYPTRKVSIFTDTDTYGLYSEAANPFSSNTGLVGLATGNSSGVGYGVYGNSTNSFGDNYGVYGRADINSTGTNYGVYGKAMNGGAGGAWAGYFYGDTCITGILNPTQSLHIASGDNVKVAMGSGFTTAKLTVSSDTAPYAIYARAAAAGDSSSCAIRGDSASDSAGSNIGVYGIGSGANGANYGIYGIATTPSSGTNIAVYGWAANSGSGDAYAGYFSGDVWVYQNVSAYSYTDRTPYPKDLATAVEAVRSMERLPDGQYEEHDKEQQLDHSKLSDFVRSKDGNRDLSATVSCHNEVLKALLGTREELLEAQARIRELREENAAMKAKLAAIETALSKMNRVQ